jgi:hypothetical protein
LAKSVTRVATPTKGPEITGSPVNSSRIPA